MRKFLTAFAIGILVSAVAQDFSTAQTAKASNPKAPVSQYEVLNPWADADPIPVRGISPRIQTLAGKKIGLFANFKRAARPIAASLQKRLATIYPGIQTAIFDSRLPNVTETETKNRDNFVAWVKGVDAVILAVGD